MRSLLTLELAVLWCGAVAADTIVLFSTKTPLRGTITSENAAGITIEAVQAGVRKSVVVPLNDVRTVSYSGESGLNLTQARSLVQAGAFDRALSRLDKIASTSNPLVERAVAFARSRVKALQALNSDTGYEDAIRELTSFVELNSDSRFRYEAYELLGQLHLAKGDAAAAQKAFTVLGETSWKEYELRARNWESRVLVAMGEYAQAITKLDPVIASPVDSPEEKRRRLEAVLLKGVCLKEQKAFAEAERLLREVIAQADPEDADLQARSHNALGESLMAADKPAEALREFLYAELVYKTEPAAQAQSLFYLNQLWRQLGHPERAAQALEKLQDNHPQSQWARLVEGSGRQGK